MDGDRPVLSKLLLGFMHLANEVDEALPGLGHPLLRPISELELSDRPGLAVLQKDRGRGSRLTEREREGGSSLLLFRCVCVQRCVCVCVLKRVAPS